MIIEAVVLLAHVGHWTIYVLYAVPVAIVLASVVTTTLRQRRERRVAEHDAAATPSGR